MENGATSGKVHYTKDSDQIMMEVASQQDPHEVASQQHPRDAALPEEEEKDLGQSRVNLLYMITILAAIDSFLFGYDTGIISSAMLFIREEYELNTLWQEILVSLTIMAAAVFSLIAGLISDWLGRKPTMVIANIAFIAGAIVLGVADSKTLLLTGRVVVGVGIGLSSMVVPIYISECSPIMSRGRLVTMHQLLITIGLLTASLTGGAFSYLHNGWRYMFGLSGIPAIIQLIGFFFIPESPRWLVQKGQVDRARDILSKLRQKRDVEEELNGIQDSCMKSKLKKTGCSAIQTVIFTVKVRRALTVGCALQVFQQLAGINTVMYYSATIIKMAGVRQNSVAIWLSSILAAVNVSFTCVGIWVVDKVGRRKLTLASYFGVFLSLVVLAIGFQVSDVTSANVELVEPIATPKPDCSAALSCNTCVQDKQCGFCYVPDTSSYNGSCLPTSVQQYQFSFEGRCSDGQINDDLIWAYQFCPTHFWWITILGMVMYIVCFAPGLGPMPWTINAEIYPLWARSSCTAMATSSNWLCNLFISMTFLSLTESITKYGTFWVYAVISLFGLIFLFCLLPETKGTSLEQVEILFTESEMERVKRKLRTLRSMLWDCKKRVGDEEETARLS